MNLYAISESLRQVIAQGFAVDDDTGEVLFDGEDLDGLEGEFAEKVEGCAIVLKGMEAEAKAIHDEREALAKREDAIKRRAASLERYMLSAMERTGSSSVETPRASVKVRSTSGVVVFDEAQVPEGYMVEKVERRPNKAKIRQALKAGEVPGAFLEERTYLQVV